jgi:hypothetical protein
MEDCLGIVGGGLKEAKSLLVKNSLMYFDVAKSWAKLAMLCFIGSSYILFKKWERRQKQNTLNNAIAK